MALRARYFAAVLLIRVGLRLFSLRFNVALVDRLARAYAWLARRTDTHILPPHTLDFPRRLLALVGDEFSHAIETQQLTEERLVFLARDILVTQASTSGSTTAARLRALIDVDGLEHLDAALAGGRGVFVITAHFGFPHLIRSVLEGYGSGVVMAQWERRRAGDIALRGDVWARAAALHSIRVALEQNHVCLFAPDVPHGATSSVPFFAKRISVGLGAFYLALRIPSPILPCYAVIRQRPRHFRVEFLPPMALDASSASDMAGQAVREFVDHYSAWISRYPSHLYDWALRNVTA